jgi:high-affinity nickel-transport protein
MYPIGFLFGLGFNTATEVALFGISAPQAADGMSLATILIFPALFTAGMCLVDTADGVLMRGAYGWAFIKPVRMLYYNVTITFASVVVVVLIGGIEALALIEDTLDPKGGFWDLIGAASNNFGLLGYAVIGLFVVSWLVSVLFYKLKRYDDMPVNLG